MAKNGPRGLGPTPAELKKIRATRLQNVINMRERRAKEHFRRVRRATQDLIQKITDTLVDEAELTNSHSTMINACSAVYPAFDVDEIRAFMKCCGLVADVAEPTVPLTQDDETPARSSCEDCGSNPRCAIITFTVDHSGT
jgi:hypothetical protein